jgi:hypothetical protein
MFHASQLSTNKCSIIGRFLKRLAFVSTQSLPTVTAVLGLSLLDTDRPLVVSCVTYSGLCSICVTYSGLCSICMTYSGLCSICVTYSGLCSICVRNTKYYAGDQIKKNEVDGACSTYGGGERCLQDFRGET